MTETVRIRTQLPSIDLEAMDRAEDYVMEDNALRSAVNAALTLGKPLLLTGEAGVGKSQFSGWLAHELGKDKQDKPHFLKFVVKSTTEARDLFYHYDALARFHAAQVSNRLAKPIEHSSNEKRFVGTAAEDIDPLRYITYNALGKAILFSMGRAEALKKGLISEVMGHFLTEVSDTQRRSVVLIDEIDKAPRDVPNDILDEIDSLAFTVRELGNVTASTDKRLRPVVVITSNSERDLPKPFLRRCVYYHMQFPSDTALERIIRARVGARFEAASGRLGQGVRVFRYLREQAGLRQPPGLAELLDWLYGLSEDGGDAHADLRQHPQFLAILKATLLKDRQDQEQFDRESKQWVDAALGAVKDGGIE